MNAHRPRAHCQVFEVSPAFIFGNESLSYYSNCVQNAGVNPTTQNKQ